MNIFSLPLLQYLRERDEMYYGKVAEFREIIGAWLSYIPSSFPHYTRHTVEHSEEIIGRLSGLLFRNGDSQKCVINLSAVEAYALIASAYLHDSGMVVSDKEKLEILGSGEWSEWLSRVPARARRSDEIVELRTTPGTDAETRMRHFVADLETRYLIAEFIRDRHAIRAIAVIDSHQVAMARFAFDDPVMSRTIRDVCASHSLRAHELEDNDRFPDRRTVRGEQVNVRLLAILLRLGDLLDMASDRACPLLLNAANPLPADSLAHWTQYQRPWHFLVAPDRIEIKADCKTQDEHRLLRDWCKWICDETDTASLLAQRFARHQDWAPPYVSLVGHDPTIVIRPASDAPYVPSDWRFELDGEEVINRLINDVYDTKYAFVRELLQNAADASRCQMYLDLERNNLSLPTNPTDVDKAVRDRYVIDVPLETREVRDDLSGDLEGRQIVIVDDPGIGMNVEVVERYFLQVARSFYVTHEFRERFPFTASSRYGVGFLSVFAVSDNVTVETYKPSQPADGPIRLQLPGPRNYLLRELGHRTRSGTRIEVELREPLEVGELTRFVRAWCKRLEFPVRVDELGVITYVESERMEDFIGVTPDLTSERASIAIRGFAISTPLARGEVYVMARATERGESWAQRFWVEHTYPTLHPQATAPALPGDLSCLNGIALSGSDDFSYTSVNISARLDYRGFVEGLTLARKTRPSGMMGVRRQPVYVSDERVRVACEELLRNHLRSTPLASGEDGWKYKQRLVREFPFPTFWSVEPGMIHAWFGDHYKTESLMNVTGAEMLTTVTEQWRPRGLRRASSPTSVTAVDQAWGLGPVALAEADLDALSSSHLAALFKGKEPISLRWLNGGRVVIQWVAAAPSNLLVYFERRPSEESNFSIAPFPSDSPVGASFFQVHDSTYEHVILNSRNEFVRWLEWLVAHTDAAEAPIGADQIKRLLKLLETPLRHRGYKVEDVNQFLNAWSSIPDLPPEWLPPMMTLSASEFVFTPGAE